MVSHEFHKLGFWVRFPAPQLKKVKDMYDIQRESGEEYLDHYIYKSRNECNQIIICEVYRTYNETLNFAFYVTTKKEAWLSRR